MKLVLYFLTFVFITEASAEVLKVRPYNRIFNLQKITLADVVDVDGLTKDAKVKISNIDLGDAPRLGEQRIYTDKAISEAIRQTLNKKKWTIKIPRKVIVDNRGFELDRKSVENELVSYWSTICAECQINLKSLQLPALPPTAVNRPWRLEKDSRLPRGHFSAKLFITLVDDREQIYWANGQVEVKKKVPILTRSTPMNTRLTADDFKMQWRDVTAATDTTPAPKEIDGQQVRYTMNANDILWQSSLVREKAVRRGEMVKIFVGEDNWQISMQARIEQDGFIGDTVNVRNLQTNRILSGRVVGAGEVQIK
ncbi:MAG: flagella basal body P-ring formation protein FlgA [Bdellovibrionales bacterium RBG_16_40_8]|nr:MAG: flagella basal body P-ring formation protein FlgA [Bdellovibrionales bacterium RBG_16_40_8]